ncbi:unnamed protein product [Oncorhynchus mykiss]|uniref:Uncharacterized protein n=1 Tax=Oncorhynchus mykiss TaxID=8022 RepID=A0A060VTY1_ONCMY|nr:unnamed protein product [Oncorhynchus mykiss]
MEATVPGCCSYCYIAMWMWLFTLTSTLDLIKTEIRCIPSCQLPVIKPAPRELSEVVFDPFGKVPEGEIVGLAEKSPLRKSEQHFANKSDSRGFEKRQSREKLSSSEELYQHQSGSGIYIPSATLNKVSVNNTRHNKINCFGRENRLKRRELSKNKVGASFRSRGRRRKRSFQTAESRATWSGFRWNSEDASTPGQHDELKLISSTFALTGDSAHNQAMVHSSGQNSSVSQTWQ